MRKEKGEKKGKQGKKKENNKQQEGDILKKH